MTFRWSHWLFLLLLAVLLFSSLPFISPDREGSLKLLTVSTVGNQSVGGTADVYLHLRPGSGNVYIATFPFTKLDTQISTRFANEVACSYVQADCSRYDFFYTIRADSSIVGGPSAGAALASLTVALLDNQMVDAGVAVTGTINAGGLVGPVAGVEEKVLAARDAGMHTVVIPRWTSRSLYADVALNQSSTNQSGVNVSAGFPSGIAVVEASTIEDVLLVLTSKDYGLVQDDAPLQVPTDYLVVMQQVADFLCDRATGLRSELLAGGVASNDSLLVQADEYLNDSVSSLAQGSFYSGASYCYSANLRLRELQLEDFSAAELTELSTQVKSSIDIRREELRDRSISTLADIQTYAIVDERLREASAYFDVHNVSYRDVAYALERYHSGVVWSSFFALDGQRLQLDDDHLKAACEQKLSEVEERKSYLSVLYGPLFSLDDASLSDAYRVYGQGEYELCLFKAAKAKAQIEVVISTSTVADEELDSFITQNLAAAKGILARESGSGRFPLMGYSYYEYASDLRADDPYVAALFSSYALELADLSIYFEPVPSLADRVVPLLIHPFSLGVFAGVLLTLLFLLGRSEARADALKNSAAQKKRMRRKV